MPACSRCESAHGMTTGRRRTQPTAGCQNCHWNRRINDAGPERESVYVCSDGRFGAFERQASESHEQDFAQARFGESREMP